MKTTIILVVCYLFVSIPNGDSQKFLDLNNSWTIEQSRFVFSLNQTLTDTFTFYLDNEVDIKGQKYLELKFLNPENTSLFFNRRFYREEDQKVFMITPDENGSEILIYDFSLELGDTMWYSQMEAVEVIAKDLIQLEDGLDRIMLELEWINNASYRNSIWIEGIGSLTSPINPLDILVTDVGLELICFNYSNQVISGTPRCLMSTSNNNITTSEVEIFPNPFSNTLKVENTNLKSMITIYNSLGKIMEYKIMHNQELNTSNWPNGVYFISIKNEEGESKTYKTIKANY